MKHLTGSLILMVLALTLSACGGSATSPTVTDVAPPSTATTIDAARVPAG